MGLILSNAPIPAELGLNPNDVQRMAEQMRTGSVERQPEPVRSEEVKCVTRLTSSRGHKVNPGAVKKCADTGCCLAIGTARVITTGKQSGISIDKGTKWVAE